MSQENLPKLTMVLGTAASGKSKIAEKMIFNSGLPRIYIATSQVWDDETKSKIEAHKIQRGPDWQTIEEPLNIAHVLKNCPGDHAVLIDCATLWLTNHLLDEADIDAQSKLLFDAIQQQSNPVAIVTNEVGAGIVPESKLGRQFRNIQGRFNQQLAEQADLVVNVIAGLPQVLKGQMP